MLRSEVRALQRLLKGAGEETSVDGFFGAGTARAVGRFQRRSGLQADGIVGPATWRALDPRIAAPTQPAVPELETFHGDLNIVHAFEGHAGQPYWPGGASGVTLDPGFDLGRNSAEQLRRLYGDILSTRELRALEPTIGLKRAEAKAAALDPRISSIRISRKQAAGVFAHIAAPYWKRSVRRFDGLKETSAPGSVQTVLLSLAYNRGSSNRDLEQLKAPIAEANWLEVADLVGAMQQDHELSGIRRRRRQEAELIRTEVEIA